MTDTKQVLGRTFTKTGFNRWECKTKNGVLAIYDHGHTGARVRWVAALERPEHCDTGYCVETGDGPTESDAILALQSTLRKMAMLEVESG